MYGYEALGNYRLIKERMAKSSPNLVWMLEKIYALSCDEMAESGILVGDGDDKAAMMFSYGLARISKSDLCNGDEKICFDIEVNACNGFQFCGLLALLSVIEDIAVKNDVYANRLNGCERKQSYKLLIVKKHDSEIDDIINTVLSSLYPWIEVKITTEDLCLPEPPYRKPIFMKVLLYSCLVLIFFAFVLVVIFWIFLFSYGYAGLSWQIITAYHLVPAGIIGFLAYKVICELNEEKNGTNQANSVMINEDSANNVPVESTERKSRTIEERYALSPSIYIQ